jgi:hypothetical protein
MNKKLTLSAVPLVVVVALGAMVIGVGSTTLSLNNPSQQLAAANANVIQTNTMGPVGTQFIPLTDFSGSPQLSSLADGVDLTSFLQGLFDLLIVVGATLAVIQITRGGFIYMTQDVISSKIKAKDIIRDAVVGLVLLLSTVLILRQINPDLVKLDLNPAPPAVSGAGNGSATPAPMTEEERRAMYRAQGKSYVYTAGNTDYCNNSMGTAVPCQ